MFTDILIKRNERVTRSEADEKLKTIEKLAREIENDKELMRTDIRYHITAKWIETGLESANQ